VTLLRALRLDAGQTLREKSATLGVSISWLSNAERGYLTQDGRAARRVERFHLMSIETLLKEADKTYA
jgi:transcriptional regulator with XRE-family HTH domain